MPVLSNPRHERFAQELAKGKTATESYETAGYKPSRANACHLQQQDNISQRIAELLAERDALHSQSTAMAVEQAALTKTWVIQQLIENALIAKGDKPIKQKIKMRGMDQPVEVELNMRDASAANRSLELLGKELGMFIDRKEVKSVDEFDTIDDVSELKQRLIARAKELGARDIAAALIGGGGEARGKPN